MEPAVASPRVETAIIADRGSGRCFRPQKASIPTLPTGVGRQNPAAGNGIFGCRDWRLKNGLRDREGHRRPKEWNDTGENPHRNALFGVISETCGLRRDRTCDPLQFDPAEISRCDVAARLDIHEPVSRHPKQEQQDEAKSQWPLVSKCEPSPASSARSISLSKRRAAAITPSLKSLLATLLPIADRIRASRIGDGQNSSRLG